MHVLVRAGDIFEEVVDVLVSTANPELNMSGGINGEILTRGGIDLQHELHAYKSRLAKRYVDPETVVVTGPGPLTNCAHIIHAVSIDVWYKSSAERIDQTVRNVLGKAQELNARSVALPGLAMGYGQLPAEEFATGLRSAITASDWAIDELRVILYRADDAQIVARVLGVELES